MLSTRKAKTSTARTIDKWADLQYTTNLKITPAIFTLPFPPLPRHLTYIILLKHIFDDYTRKKRFCQDSAGFLFILIFFHDRLKLFPYLGESF